MNLSRKNQSKNKIKKHLKLKKRKRFKKNRTSVKDLEGIAKVILDTT